MIVLSNTTAQSLAAGATVIFDRTLLKTGCCCELQHRANSSAVRVKTKRPVSIEFHGNISGGAATTAVSLGIYENGALLPETAMRSVSVAANDVNNVSARTIIGPGCCCGAVDNTITVVNTGAATVTLAANSTLIIEEVPL